MSDNTNNACKKRKRNKDVSKEDDTRQKIYYKNYFEYTTNDQKEKIGVCLICLEKDLRKEFKMKNGNTKGIKGHLERDHKEIYDLHFDPTSSKSQPSLPKNQTTLDDFTNVSTKYIDFVFIKMVKNFLSVTRGHN